MNKYNYFCDVVSLLLNKKNDINEIKKLEMFKNIPESFWNGFEKIKLRINQQTVLDDIQKNGITTGIHCQATGCGKSYIILMYCNYFQQNNMKGNIIIFTERVSILEDFFDLKNKHSKTSDEKKYKWKNNNIIDLDNFDVINMVNDKNKEWYELLQNNDDIKPKILLINRAFLTLKQKYLKLNNEHVGMIIHDECHNTPSDQCYKMLLHFKKYNIPIIGFSATPLRTGKTSNEFNRERLINIYGNNANELIILSNFNMIYAIENKLILPPKFKWYDMPKFPLNKDGNPDDKKKLTVDHVKTIFSVLDDVVPELPFKKIIAWCGTIKFAEKWCKIFIDNAHTIDITFKNFTFFIDHSKIKKDSIVNDYEKFKEHPNNAILFCANKHREGSDIPNLDCCIFIDFVKNRGAIPFIQSIGRVLRINGTNKTQGYVIDSFVSNVESYERELVDKIIGYYLSFENLSDFDVETNKYDKYIKIKNMTNFSAEDKQIFFKLKNNNIINIDCKNLHWLQIVDKFESILQNKIKLSSFDNLKSKATILKDIFNFNKNTDFINEYRNICEKDKIKYNLPNIDDDEYLNIFNTYTWFDVLDIEHDFIELNELILQLKNIKINNIVWNKLVEKNSFIPLYPKYVYNNFTFTLFNNTCISEV
jgi:superfamily II DNA or RNA helicase